MAIVTDSTPYLPRTLIERWQISQVSLYVGWDGDLRPEHEYADLDAFYARLRDSPQLPTTSQPSVGDFLTCYQPLVSAGPRRALDPHRRAACRARARAHARPRGLLPTRDIPGGSRCSTAKPAPAASAASSSRSSCRRAGRDARRGRERPSAARRASLDIWFCLDTLEYLRRGGRIGAAQAMVGTALKVKPILTFGTEIAPVGRVRTAPACPRADGRLPARAAASAAPSTGSCSTRSRRTTPPTSSPRARAIFGSEPLFCTEVGPVLGAHLGAGMLVGGLTREPVAG